MAPQGHANWPRKTCLDPLSYMGGRNHIHQRANLFLIALKTGAERRIRPGNPMSHCPKLGEGTGVLGAGGPGLPNF